MCKSIELHEDDDSKKHKVEKLSAGNYVVCDCGASDCRQLLRQLAGGPRRKRQKSMSSAAASRGGASSARLKGGTKKGKSKRRVKFSPTVDTVDADSGPESGSSDTGTSSEDGFDEDEDEDGTEDEIFSDSDFETGSREAPISIDGKPKKARRRKGTINDDPITNMSIASAQPFDIPRKQLRVLCAARSLLQVSCWLC